MTISEPEMYGPIDEIRLEYERTPIEQYGATVELNNASLATEEEIINIMEKEYGKEPRKLKQKLGDPAC